MIDFVNITPDGSQCPDLMSRLQRRDPSLWSDDPDTRRDIDNRLGWLDAAAFMDRHTGRILDFARQVQSEEQSPFAAKRRVPFAFASRDSDV